MLNHPIVRKDYVFAANFAPKFRYNEQALVYSGLLARNTAFVDRNRRLGRETITLIAKTAGLCGSAAFAQESAAHIGKSTVLRLKDRPQ